MSVKMIILSGIAFWPADNSCRSHKRFGFMSKIRDRIRSISDKKIRAGYLAGNFDVAVPFNTREIDGVGLTQFLSWVALLAVLLFQHSMLVICLVALSIGLSALAVLLLENAAVTLPIDARADKFHLDMYGSTTRAGLWSPMAHMVVFGTYAPFRCFLVLIVLGILRVLGTI